MSDTSAPTPPPAGSRPCRQPDGGCGAPVVFYPSTTTASPMVLDAVPRKAVVLVAAADPTALATPTTSSKRARVVDVYTDHHGTCPKWAAKVAADRERAAGRRDRRGGGW